jgi:hypothetical protein
VGLDSRFSILDSRFSILDLGFPIPIVSAVRFLQSAVGAT